MVRLTGSLGERDGRGVVRIEDRLAAGIDDTWAAITEPDRLARWYGDVDGALHPGGELRLHVRESGWTGRGRIGTCEPPRRLVVVTREDDAPFEGGVGVAPFDEVIEATLGADGDATRLVVEVSGAPLDAVAFYGAGWQVHVEHLADHLAGRTPGGEGRFDELVGPYQALAADLPGA